MTDDRKAFEAWISAPPFERTCKRNPQSSAWPGKYADYPTEIAWEAWQAGRAPLLAENKRLRALQDDDMGPLA